MESMARCWSIRFSKTSALHQHVLDPLINHSPKAKYKTSPTHKNVFNKLTCLSTCLNIFSEHLPLAMHDGEKSMARCREMSLTLQVSSLGWLMTRKRGVCCLDDVYWVLYMYTIVIDYDML